MTDSPPSDRRAALQAWLTASLAARGERPLGPAAPLTADASFRRFERIATVAGSRIVMDAPPATERNAEFVAIAAWLEAAGLQAPRVLDADLEHGFLLVTDLGDLTLEQALRAANPTGQTRLYGRAIDTLIALQRAAQDLTPPFAPFAPYDRERLDLENGLFRSWFIEGLLALDAPGSVLDDVLETLTEAHLGAPRAGIHLDWHCRNLLVLDQEVGAGTSMGIVDFQDARIGPVCYDLVSLLRDCYQPPSDERVERGIEHYLAAARTARIEGVHDRAAFLRAFDLIGMQRHLKAIGIFARLHLRDGRDHALADIPRTLDHLLAVAPRHRETQSLALWLSATVAPALERWRTSREAKLKGESA